MAEGARSAAGFGERGSILPLRVEGLGYRARGEWLLRDVSFTLRAGGIAVLLGPNGAGKSLTLRLCHGMLRPSGGLVSWNGPPAEVRGRQAMVFQRPRVLRRSVRANLAFALRARRVPRALRDARTREALAVTGLDALEHRPAHRLSEGERHRLALARAFVVEPEVVFLDEPTASLDPAATAALEGAIRRVAADGTKVILSTHDLGQARRLADEVLFFHRGRLLEKTPAESFFRGPRTPEARAFLKGELLA